MPIYTLKVTEEHNHLRLDVFLTQSLPNIPSRSSVQRLIEQEHVLVNNRPPRARYKVVVDDEIVVSVPEVEEEIAVEPENIPLDIFYEDDDLLVLNKPVGMPVHPGIGHRSGTLANALLYHCRSLSDVNGPIRPGIVHRLDQETSGLMLVAKNNQTHVRLARQFERRQIQKCYVALVKGLIEFDEGVVNAPIGRHPRNFQKKAVAFDDEAKESETIYQVMHRYKDVTMVALFPQTGRTHQLRVHMAHLGHPILGDEKYGRNNPFPRLALHAQSLGFHHPRTNAFLEFTCRVPFHYPVEGDKN